MAISRAVISSFLQRTLDIHDWIKTVDESVLDQELDSLRPRPVFHTKPYKHQKAVFLLLLEYPGFLPFLNMGLGKSKVVLDLLTYRKIRGEGLPALIVVPGRAHIAGWEREVEIHQPSLDVIYLTGSSQERRLVLQTTDADLYILNYQGLTVLCRQPGKKGKSTINKAETASLAGKFNTLVMDESQHVSNHRALATRICEQVAAGCDYRIAMTGTPHGRDPQLVWSQFHLCDGGETLGQTLGIFRGAFFHRNRNHFGGYEYEIRANRKKHLYRTMKHRSIFYSSEECLDLPDRIDQQIICQMPALTRKTYHNLVEEMNQGLAEGGSTSKFSLVKNTFIRLRQLSGGFLVMKDSDTGDSEILEFPENPKLEALVQRIEEMPPDRKAVVFHEFIHSGRVISNALSSENIANVSLRGETKDPAAVLSRFVDDPSARVLVANHKSGGSGLNLQVANYVFFYESPVSSMARSQAEKRCWRMGQDRRVYFYDLLTKGSVDERILAYIEEGSDLLTALMQGKEVWQ